MRKAAGYKKPHSRNKAVGVLLAVDAMHLRSTSTSAGLPLQTRLEHLCQLLTCLVYIRLVYIEPVNGSAKYCRLNIKLIWCANTGGLFPIAAVDSYLPAIIGVRCEANQPTHAYLMHPIFATPTYPTSPIAQIDADRCDANGGRHD